MVINFLVVVFLLAGSSILAAMETAVIGASVKKIKLASSKGVKNSDKVLALISSRETLISVVVISENVLSTLATTLITYNAIQLIGQEHGLIASSIITPILAIIFCDILPKIVAVTKAESILIRSYYLFKFLLVLFAPLNQIINRGTAKLRRHIKPDPLYENCDHQQCTDQPDIDFKTGNLTVASFMHKLESLQSVDYDLEPKELLDAILTTGHSRVPIWRSSKENLIGILEVQTMLRALQKQSSDENLKLAVQNSIMAITTIKDETLISEQLINFTKQKYNFAIVVNNNEVPIGFLTLSDLLVSFMKNHPDLSNTQAQ